MAPIAPRAQTWQTQFCPILTAAIQPTAKPASTIALPPGAAPRDDDSFSAHPCQGPQCAFFQPIADEHGRVVDGKCCVPLLGIGMNTLGNALMSVLLDKRGSVATPDAPTPS